MKRFFIFIILLTFSATAFADQHKSSHIKRMHQIPGGLYESFFIKENSRPMRVAPFMMDETAVTNAEYLEFVKANPKWRRSQVSRLYADKNYLSHWKGDLEPGSNDPNWLQAPVVNVSWFAAQAYAHWKGKRLPTIAEWEIAGASAPKNKKISSLTEYILHWYKRPNPKVLPPIKSTYQNKYGLYDMHGLVWEWTFDFNSFISKGDSRGNAADELKAFCAAGALNVKDKEDYATYLRFSYRGSLKGNFCIQNLGFRCAKNI